MSKTGCCNSLRTLHGFLVASTGILLAQATSSNLLAQEKMAKEPVYTIGDSNRVFVEMDTPRPKRFEISADLSDWSSSPTTVADDFWTFRGLVDGQRYWYRVVFLDGLISNIVSSIQDQTSPSLIRAEIPEESSSPMDEWLDRGTFNVVGEVTDPAGIWIVKLYRRKEGEPEWGGPVAADTLASTLTDTGYVFSNTVTVSFPQDLTDGKYEFRIEGVDGTHSPASHDPDFELAGNEHIPISTDTAHVRISIDTRPPDPVTIDTCYQTIDTLFVEWSKPPEDPEPSSGLEGYFIHRDGVLIDSVSVPTTSYKDTMVECPTPTTYVYQVFPFDSLRNTQSQADTAYCACLPPAEIEMFAEPQYTKGDSNIVYGRTDRHFNLITVYREDLESGAKDSVTWADVDSGETREASFDGLEHGKTYRYWAEGMDPQKNDVKSNAVLSTQDTLAPEVRQVRVPELEASECLNTSHFIVEGELTDAAGIWIGKLYRRLPGETWPIDPVATDTLACTLTDTGYVCPKTATVSFAQDLPDGKYEFRIEGVDGTHTPASHDPDFQLAGNEHVPGPNDSTHDVILVDTAKPSSKISPLSPVQQIVPFEVHYTASDTSENTPDVAGLDSVTLFYGFGTADQFERDTTHVFPDNPSKVDSFFVFSPPRGDGQYFLYTKAYDACGNVQIDTLMEMTGVNAIPKVLSIFPEPGSFFGQSDVDSIEIVFDRVVKPATAWSQVIQVENNYSCSESAVTCTFESDTAAVDTLICWPNSIDATGYYQIQIDSSKLLSIAPNLDPPQTPLDSYTFNFFTYMEAGQGGTICAPEGKLIVPAGELQADVVIKLNSSELGACNYPGFNVISASATTIEAFNQPDVRANIEVAGTLCLNYQGFDTGSDTRGCRVFKQLSGGCLPAGNKDSWHVDETAQMVCSTIDNVIGVFYIGCPAGPSERALGNYPNPFGAGESLTTKITYFLDNTNAPISLRIYDQFGNLVRNFNPASLTQHNGLNECPWDGTNDLGEKVANGGYIAVFMVDGRVVDRRKIGVMR